MRPTEQDECRQMLLHLAEQRYTDIVATGKTIPWSDMRRYLEERKSGKKPALPNARKLPDRQAGN